MLERLIGGAAVDNHARDLGLNISDAALLEQIMQDPNFKDATGNFSPAVFQQALRNIGLSEQGFLASQRETNLRRQILTTIGKVVNTPEVLVDALNRYNGETRTLRYVLVAQEAAGSVGDPTDDDLKRYYDNHHAKFTQPEFRKVGILAVTPETVKEQVKITDQDLRPPTRRARTRSASPRRGTCSRSLSPTWRPRPPLTEDPVRHRFRRSRQGARLERGRHGSRHGHAHLSLADPAVADAAFKLELNKVSDPVTGKLGTVVLLRVTEIDTGQDADFRRGQGRPREEDPQGTRLGRDLRAA